MKIDVLKLDQLDKVAMGERELSQLTGGNCCGCGCNGPSSTTDNANANWNYGYSQSAGGEKQCACWGSGSWDEGW